MLGRPAQQPTQDRTVTLTHLLATPPSLEQLRHQMQATVRYAGVPVTPNPRRNKIDRGLWSAQQKIESCLHNICQFLETQDDRALGVGAAMARSAWEDLHQQRRTVLAGRQSYKLDPRVDDDRPKLLSKEESAKIVPRGPPKPKPKPARFYWGESSQSSGARNPPFRGKGKGKGKTRSNSTSPPEGARSPPPPREPGNEMVGKILPMSILPAQNFLNSQKIQEALDRNKLNAPT